MQLDTFTEISRAVPAFAVVSSAKVSVFSGSAAPFQHGFCLVAHMRTRTTYPLTQ